MTVLAWHFLSDPTKLHFTGAPLVEWQIHDATLGEVS